MQGTQQQFGARPCSGVDSDTPSMLIASVLSVLIREMRAWWRLLCVAALVTGGIFVVCLLFPRMRADHKRQIKQRWSRILVGTLGVKIESGGQNTPGSAFVVCNHISWLDVFILNALHPTTFVSKDDVMSWPALGTLVRHSGTLFIERGSRSAAARAAQAITERLHNEHERVAVFPEGTTTNGLSLLPFRAALFQAAVEAQVPVIPVSLRYLDRTGQTSLTPAYDGDITFGQSMMSIIRAPRTIARLQFLAPLPEGLERRELAVLAEAQIATSLGLATPAHTEILEAETEMEEIGSTKLAAGG